MGENDKSKDEWCKFYFYGLSRISSGATEIEWLIWESDTSGSDRSRFHCIVYKVGRCDHSFCLWQGPVVGSGREMLHLLNDC
jgi:hypothetical protein